MANPAQEQVHRQSLDALRQFEEERNVSTTQAIMREQLEITTLSDVFSRPKVWAADFLLSNFLFFFKSLFLFPLLLLFFLHTTFVFNCKALHFFKRHMQREFCEENLLFYLDVQDLKGELDVSVPDKVSQVFIIILNFYVF